MRLGLVVSTASAVGAGAVRTWMDVPATAVVGGVVLVAGALSWRST